MTDNEYEELYNKGFEEGFVDEIEEESEIEDEAQEIENEDTEENSEDIEQPEDENDDINSSDEEEETAEDENIEEETEDSSETENKSGRTIKWNGQEITIEDDEIDSFIQKGFDYTRKAQDLAKWRQFIELIDESKLSIEDIATLKEAKNGNADALGKIASVANVDVFDINTNSNYKPKVEARNYELEDVVEAIKSDTENSSAMDNYLSSVPETTKDFFIQNPSILQGLHEDQRNGVAGRVMPEVIKALTINPNADFLQTYRSVGERIFRNEQTTTDKKAKKPEASRDKKKKAALSKKSKSSVDTHKSVWEDDDLFEEMNRKIASMRR